MNRLNPDYTVIVASPESQSDLIMTRQKAKRVTLTPKEKAQKILDQHGRCAKCGDRLVRGNVEYDHKITLVKRDPNKPYTRLEEYQGQWAICADPCHKLKTKQDSKDHAHIARLEREQQGLPKRKRKSRKIQSPGFSKTLSQGFDGKVRKRK